MRRAGYQLPVIGCSLCLLLSATEPADVLRQHVVEQAKGGKLVLPVKSGPGKAAPATILAADDNRLLVSAQGAELNLTWKMLGDDGLYELCQPLVAKAPGAVHAAYLQLAARLGRADGPGFEKLLNQLWEKDADAAKSVEALLKSPKKDAEPAKAQPESKDGEKTGTASREKSGSSDSLASLAGGIIGHDGKVNRDAYAREALSHDVLSLQRKLGPDYEYFHKSGKAEEFPTLPAATDKSSGKIGRNGQGFTYQFGAPVADPGGYWTTEGQVLYVPDKPNDHGVDRVDVASFGHHCLQFKPEPAWWGGAHPEPAVTQKSWAQAAGGSIGMPFAIERAYWSFSQNGFMLFTSGLIGAASVNNIYTYPCLMIPKPKVPTAIALTHQNEYALVTVWDLQECKGQLAVLALESVQNDKDPKGIWGLSGWGIIRRMKLLGFVDLPGLCAPTDIATCGNATGILNPVCSNEFKLDDAAVRKKLYDEKGKILSAGFAAIVSRSENKLAVVDLRPLFSFAKEMYFTTPENLQKTKDAGLDPKQWPYSFDAEPRIKPQVVAVLDVPTPTAVKTSLFNHDKHSAKIVVTSMDGRVFIYEAGALAEDNPKGTREVKPFAMAQVGRNPTCIAYQRYADPFRKATQGTDVGGWFAMNFTFLISCRGDREIDWLEITPKGAEVYRRLRDSRIVDPVHCQQTRVNSPDGAYLVTIADFKGRKLLNYRVGDAHIDGKTIPIPDGKSELEFTGAMEFPGYVFRINSDNVP